MQYLTYQMSRLVIQVKPKNKLSYFLVASVSNKLVNS